MHYNGPTGTVTGLIGKRAGPAKRAAPGGIGGKDHQWPRNLVTCWSAAADMSVLRLPSASSRPARACDVGTCGCRSAGGLEKGPAGIGDRRCGDAHAGQARRLADAEARRPADHRNDRHRFAHHRSRAAGLPHLRRQCGSRANRSLTWWRTSISSERSARRPAELGVEIRQSMRVEGFAAEDATRRAALFGRDERDAPALWSPPTA